MEVHAPHHPLNTWRDFFIHIVTITIGLLIALGLEAMVEAMHHRHERFATRDDLRAELADNQKQLPANLKSLEAERRELEGDLAFLQKLKNHQAPGPGEKIRFGWQWSSMSDAAWQTARETGVLAYLPTEQVQEYSGIYGQQALVNAAGLALSREMTAAEIPLKVEPDLAKLTPALIDELIRDCAANLNEIEYAETLAIDLGPSYKEALDTL